MANWSTTPNEDERSTNILVLPGVIVCAFLGYQEIFAAFNGRFT